MRRPPKGTIHQAPRAVLPGWRAARPQRVRGSDPDHGARLMLEPGQRAAVPESPVHGRSQICESGLDLDRGPSRAADAVRPPGSGFPWVFLPNLARTLFRPGVQSGCGRRDRHRPMAAVPMDRFRSAVAGADSPKPCQGMRVRWSNGEQGLRDATHLFFWVFCGRGVLAPDAHSSGHRDGLARPGSSRASTTHGLEASGARSRGLPDRDRKTASRLKRPRRLPCRGQSWPPIRARRCLPRRSLRLEPEPGSDGRRSEPRLFSNPVPCISSNQGRENTARLPAADVFGCCRGGLSR